MGVRLGHEGEGSAAEAEAEAEADNRGAICSPMSVRLVVTLCGIPACRHSVWYFGL